MATLAGFTMTPRNDTTDSRALWPRFFAKVDKSDDCWVWTGARWSRGYGQLRGDGRRLLAHRVAWQLVNGPIPDGLQVCHRCDNPPCVRPDHLFLGSASINALDRDNKGRNGQAAKAYCPAGHEYSDANTYRNRNGHRRCRACHRASVARHSAKVRREGVSRQCEARR
jgi:HNH endonuclease